MKKLRILSIVIVAMTMMSFANMKFHTDVFKVDTKQSVLQWYAEKLTGKHNGTIMLADGELKNNHGNLTGVLNFDMTSISNKDMDEGEWKGKLETHLKSADFFDVAKYPVSKFEITSVIPAKSSKTAGATHTVKGLLTIKDKTNEISFDAEIKMMPKSISCKGSAVVDRTKFDIKYRSKSYFPDIGDKMIYDEFILKFDVVAFL